MNWITITGGIIGSSILLYKTYYYGKQKFQKYIMEKVLEELNNRMEIETEMFKPHSSNSAVINITSGGKNHHVYVPYHIKKATSMLRKRFYLMKNGEKIELKQKPGIPYLVSANHLEGQSIIVEDLEGNIIQTFSESEIPII